MILFIFTFLFMAALIIVPFFLFQKYVSHITDKREKMMKTILFIVIPEMFLLIVGIVIIGLITFYLIKNMIG